MRKDTSFVLCINHCSMMDIIVNNMVDLNFRWISKKEVYKIPVIGWLLWIQGNITIDRGDVSSTRKMFKDSKDKLNQGISVAIFPEGTRSKDGTLKSFKEGGFLIAKQAQKPILPIVTYGSWECTHPGDGKSGIKAPLTFVVSILPEITVEDVRSTPTRELSKRVHEAMLAEHKRIAPDTYRTMEMKKQENN